MKKFVLPLLLMASTAALANGKFDLQLSNIPQGTLFNFIATTNVQQITQACSKKNPGAECLTLPGVPVSNFNLLFDNISQENDYNYMQICKYANGTDQKCQHPIASCSAKALGNLTGKTILIKGQNNTLTCSVE
jgi:hypothetical protein